jgi:hypothetical protein
MMGLLKVRLRIKEPFLEDLGVTKKQSHNWQKLARADGPARKDCVLLAKPLAKALFGGCRWLGYSCNYLISLVGAQGLEPWTR